MNSQSNDTETDNCSGAHEKSQLHVAIIGTGSAAFACAIKAAEAGARVTLIEGGEVIGGCCVNVGCVPSKVLIRAAQLAQQQRSNPFAGLGNHSPALNRAMLARQQTALVEQLRQAKYQNILDTNPALTLMKGHARFENSASVTVSKPDGTQQRIKADRILVATGSAPAVPPIEGLAATPYWTSTEALFAESMARHLIVIGSSVVALEIAQAYRRLGSEVTVLARHTLLYREEPLLGERLKPLLEAEGVKVLENCEASAVAHQNGTFTLETGEGKVIGDRLLICTGRNANTQQLGLNTAGVEVEASGAIVINERMETSASHIYAAGDCTSMPQYVYVAAAAGSRAGANMVGGDAKLDLSVMPAVIFTDPQVATVGLTEAQARAQGMEVDTRVLDMENVPRALANFETAGFIKLVVAGQTGRLLGAQILAHDGGEVIQSAALAIRNGMTVDDIADQLFPYLTMVEGLKLCAQTFSKDVSELSCCAG